jgi:hypothetical protein
LHVAFCIALYGVEGIGILELLLGGTDSRSR